MRRTRVIPTLLLQDNGLVKTEIYQECKVCWGSNKCFIKIFNKKEYIRVSIFRYSGFLNQGSKKELKKEFASEAFFPK